MMSWKWEGAAQPQHLEGSGDFFHFLFYFWLLTQCLTYLLISKRSSVCDTQRNPVHECVKGSLKPPCFLWGLLEAYSPQQ